MTEIQRDHEIRRIEEARAKASGDREKFTKLMLLRASRCGREKLNRFQVALAAVGEVELAQSVNQTIAIGA